jgi:MFS transporter, BCD family, chlorophyll transporter
MSLAGRGADSREGTRMGVWGAAQAIAFGSGGVLATAAVDVARRFWASPAEAYSFVFVLEASVFAVAALLAAAATRAPDTAPRPALAPGVLAAGP